MRTSGFLRKSCLLGCVHVGASKTAQTPRSYRITGVPSSSPSTHFLYRTYSLPTRTFPLTPFSETPNPATRSEQINAVRLSRPIEYFIFITFLFLCVSHMHSFMCDSVEPRVRRYMQKQCFINTYKCWWKHVKFRKYAISPSFLSTGSFFHFILSRCSYHGHCFQARSQAMARSDELEKLGLLKSRLYLVTCNPVPIVNFSLELL